MLPTPTAVPLIDTASFNDISQVVVSNSPHFLALLVSPAAAVLLALVICVWVLRRAGVFG